MTYKHFIELADVIRRVNDDPDNDNQFSQENISAPADFCLYQNPRFNREKTLAIILCIWTVMGLSYLQRLTRGRS